jgi:phage terminase large subunit-like protein
VEILRGLPQDKREEFLAACTPAELELIRTEVDNAPESADFQPLPHQVLPLDGPHRGFLLTGGRGAGKSQTLTYNAVQHLKGPPCSNRVAGGHMVMAISPTAEDAVKVFALGPTSIPALWPGARLGSGAGGTHITCPNGAWVSLRGASNPEDVERFRASGNVCMVLADEVAAWRQEDVWDIVSPGLRLGPHPRWLAATTPKNRALYKKLLKLPNAYHKHATFLDNPFFPEEVKQELLASMSGRMRRQELDGELIEDVEGALWEREWLDRALAGHPVGLRRVVVGVDPSGSETGDETGIVVVGIDEIDTIWVLEDASLKGTPAKRFETICLVADRHNAGLIVHEAQFSGDNYSAGIKMAWDKLADAKRVPAMCPRVKRTAARGSKFDRAMPVAALYEDSYGERAGEDAPVYIKHVPGLSTLEDQQCTWESDSGWSPDRIDALVYAVRELSSRAGSSVRMVPRPSLGGLSSSVPTTSGGPGAVVHDPSGRQAAAIAQRLGLYVPGAN